MAWAKPVSSSIMATNCPSRPAAFCSSGWSAAWDTTSHRDDPSRAAMAAAFSTVVFPMPRGGLLMIRRRRRSSCLLLTTHR